MEIKPLVSVVVISYNSEETIIETLNSVKEQTYRNIELVISDDGSTDKTKQCVREWIARNGDEFPVVFVETPVNTGVPANCNRAISHCKGEWIKLIAADDLLVETCIEDFLRFCRGKPEARIVYSDYSCFVGNKMEHKIVEHRLDSIFNAQFNNMYSDQLYVYIELEKNITPSLFYQKSVVEQIGGFNERYKLFEDTPFIVEVLKQGIHIYHLEKDTVLYRKDNISISRKSFNTFYKTSFVECRLMFKKEIVYPLYRWYNIDFWINEYSFRFLYWFVVRFLNNENNKRNYIIYSIVKALNPYYLFKLIAKKR